MTNNSSAEKPEEWIITNEFAQVRLTIDKLGNDPRLKIEDLTTNRSIALDAFMLAGLTTASQEELKQHMDPNPKEHPRDTKG
jgi:hypothetical protein